MLSNSVVAYNPNHQEIDGFNLYFRQPKLRNYGECEKDDMVNCFKTDSTGIAASSRHHLDDF